MKLFDPPPPTKWNVLSLGAGVQSSCLALMAAKGEVTPKPDFAVFADTQAEPQQVMEWLEYLKKEISSSEYPFPIYTVTKGNLTEDCLVPVVKKRDNGKGMPVGSSYLKNLIPLFGQMPNGNRVAAIGRRCTSDYKIVPIHNKIKELCGVSSGQKNVTVTQWIGISMDELQRMKESRLPWLQHRWPLIEHKMSRRSCLDWMKNNGYPEPPRSACYYCPFHSDKEWRRLRDENPVEFAKAIQFDEDIRSAYKKYDKNMKMSVYLHNSCKPLAEIDFDSDEQKGQMTWDFQAECEGMCGV